MCYPGSYFQEAYHSTGSHRRLVAPVRREAEDGGCVSKEVCVCSPTSHPGSFRCRRHRVEYQWVRRVGSKSI
ncbi:hypothetical protein PHJA_001032100 [Phtheirospermum japonicum]|uniref:Uncharacterized protein n=1 Tax=Phtheirospermum japonicum TaxID=374723 RepID=A0A830BX51_9LAMI|nr:hypothetical protein PHJA_001032100 [Phtheirospermum japonicum]